MATPTTSSDYSFVWRTGITTIDALLEGVKWRSSIITYSFPDEDSYWSTSRLSGYGSLSSGREPWSDLLDFFTDTEKSQFELALTKWSNVAKIQFVETVDDINTVGDIRIAFSWMASTDSAEAWAYAPDGDPVGGDIWINTDSNSYLSGLPAGSYGFLTLLHELGHTIGLKHPHEPTSTNWAELSLTQDVLQHTLMSYFAAPGEMYAYLSYYPTTPMLYDIQAIQHIYGKNTTFNATNTVYNYDDSTTYLETIWDGGGINTISYTGTQTAIIDLREGYGSNIGNVVTARDSLGTYLDTIPNVWIAYDTTIHNAIGGSGSNTLIGNDLDNTLTGGTGSNTISSGLGNDTIVLTGTGLNLVDGGSGLDTLVLDGTRSGFTVAKSSNGFTVTGSGGMSGHTLLEVERITFSDNTIALDIDGNAGTAYRLYQAAFDRTPDTAGLGYWIDKMDNGMGIIDVAAGFFNSAEFKALYGESPSNTDYINRFYGNVLHRTPDEGGFNYWMNELTNGHRSPVIALAQFSESPENQAQVIGVIQNGMEYTAVA